MLDIYRLKYHSYNVLKPATLKCRIIFHECDPTIVIANMRGTLHTADAHPKAESRPSTKSRSH